jgi:tetratricopeptide (TPR) repeat protein
MAHASERLTKLMAMLEKSPADPFLLYGIGMEHKKTQDWKGAIDYFDRTIAADKAYCYAYFQKGQTCEAAGDVPGARAAYRAGIEAAGAAGDAHAREEIAGALGMIE